jgi:CRP/FNR family cyclic AMP-dependent transcriptional regulator
VIWITVNELVILHIVGTRHAVHAAGSSERAADWRYDMDPIAVLQQTSLLKGLADDALRAIAGRTIVKRLPRDTILFREGEPCRGLYVVTGGRVVAYQASPDGREQVLDTVEPGNTIAELPLFDGGPYPASARALEDSEVLFLSLDDFQELYRTHPEIAHHVIQRLGVRMRRLVQLVNKLSLKDVPSRVAASLLEYAAAAAPLRDGVIFRMPRRHYELAAELSTTRESVTRALIRMREEGVISQRGPSIQILSVAKLRQFAAGGVTAPLSPARI